jgi:hypothetical protein
MTARSLLSVVLLLLTAGFVQAQSAPPPAIALDGVPSVPLAAHARRTHLLGTFELYNVAVYVDGSIRDLSHLSSRAVPKALRLEVTFEDDLRRRLTIDWRRELIPALEPAAVTQLRGTFGALNQGDVVVVDYTPAKGTAVRVNKAVAVSGANHDLMLAFLDHWLGQRPVSDEIRRALVGS